MNILPLLIAYFVGSIPFGLIIGKLMGKDIRKIGSGNIGATNVFRNFGAIPGALVLFLDAAKGAVPVFIALSMTGPDFQYKYLFFILTGAFAMIGHMFPVYLGFKGGKGGATGMGVLATLMPDIALISAITFIAVLLITRYVSVSTMTAAVIAAISAWYTAKPTEYLVIVAIMTAFIIYKHVPNIKRIITGTEPKAGRS